MVLLPGSCPKVALALSLGSTQKETWSYLPAQPKNETLVLLWSSARSLALLPNSTQIGPIPGSGYLHSNFGPIARLRQPLVRLRLSLPTIGITGYTGSLSTVGDDLRGSSLPQFPSTVPACYPKITHYMGECTLDVSTPSVQDPTATSTALKVLVVGVHPTFHPRGSLPRNVFVWGTRRAGGTHTASSRDSITRRRRHLIHGYPNLNTCGHVCNINTCS